MPATKPKPGPSGPISDPRHNCNLLRKALRPLLLMSISLTFYLRLAHRATVAAMYCPIIQHMHHVTPGAWVDDASSPTASHQRVARGDGVTPGMMAHGLGGADNAPPSVQSRSYRVAAAAAKLPVCGTCHKATGAWQLPPSYMRAAVAAVKLQGCGSCPEAEGSSSCHTKALPQSQARWRGHIVWVAEGPTQAGDTKQCLRPQNPPLPANPQP